MAEYGFAASFLKSNREIRLLVGKATAGGWEMDKFLDSLKVTKWWKARSDAQKRYDIERYENPAQINESVRQKAAVITRMIITMGMALSRKTVVALANQAVRNGLDDAELRYLVGTRYSHGGNTGMIGKARSDLTKMAGDFGLKVSTGAVNNQIETILQGVRTVEDYATYYRDIAKQQYQGAAAQLDQGFTLRQILDPYLQVAAEELGKSAGQMDITNGMWTAAVQYRGEDAKSATPQRMMSQDEWIRTIRTDKRYGFDQSQNAQRAGSVLATQLGQRMGAFG